MTFLTQMAAARCGTITPQVRQVLIDEKIHENDLLTRIAEGRIVIPANRNHTSLLAKGIGAGLTTKINVNLGVSEDCCNVEAELQKVRRSIELKADAIMDLSTFGDTRAFRKRAVEISPAMIGTVPVYDAVARYGKDVAAITVDDFFDVVRMHAEDGVDFMTIHAGLTQTAIQRLRITPRLTHIVSRGGSLLLDWMTANDKENPFYEHFDRLLELCRQYDVTLSLGDGLRPGSLRDATDAAQIQELIFLGELTKRCWQAEVQVMIEGPGHVPLNEVAANMLLEKKLCHGAPFYVLGPIVTDVAPGYDHITSAIGGALAAAHGADFLCYVTPAEHLRLPDQDDMKEGIIAARIAAHAADIAKGIPGAIDWDNAMSAARRDLDWDRMFGLALDPEKAKAYRASSKPVDQEVCTMCGDLCAVKRSRTILQPETDAAS
ncbi:phosphomethylpyrimidine synthase ThiC [Desulfobulbus oligotrophicus]|uniref:Phosphomethylpyrimidine synthase n=1 Tax=Desulfobulbus oligotrophicus TaxID=1909699 RepID=A0A7T5VEP3_9BACT|nr:phosphomethylpyrimidine synthase ThiC [Desulfobulbus oligotrophicus]QQG66407.1 phosphomethylpyrimidine synthase ThiC [Desulfobulbus oligotrophicus]